MGSVVSAVTGGLFGGGGSGQGYGYQPQGVDIINPVTEQQRLNANGSVDTGLGQQQAFARAVQAQNGLANQSNVYNQMQGVANGTGPNPAQAQLAQATGANVANQAAMAAGQRGANANVGLMERNVGRQGAGIQQAAAGQAASLQAQQSLNALGQMGALSTNQANQAANANNAYSQAALANQQNVLGSTGAYNNARVGMQSNLNNSGTSLATATMGGQGNMLGNLMGGVGMIGNLIPGMGGGGKDSGVGSILGTGDSSQNGFTGATGYLGDQPVGGGTTGMLGSTPAATTSTTGMLGDYTFSGYAEGGEVDSNGSTAIDKSLIKMEEVPEALPVDPAPSTGPQSQTAKNLMRTGAIASGPMVMGGMQKGMSGGSDQPMDSGAIATRGVNGLTGALGGGGTGSHFGPVGVAVGAGVGGAQGLNSKPQEGHGYGGSGWNWGQAGSGAASGALSGAAIGSVVPGIGTAIGAIGGGLIGGIAGGLRHAEGGMVPALVSPGEKYLPPKDVEKVKKGEAAPLEVGEKIPGKPKVGGAQNSYANDTVPKTLESGGIVLPRSVTQAKDAPEKAAAFVAAVLKKQALKRDK